MKDYSENMPAVAIPHNNQNNPPLASHSQFNANYHKHHNHLEDDDNQPLQLTNSDLFNATTYITSLLSTLGKGYNCLAQFECKDAIRFFKLLDRDQFYTGRVLCQVAKAQSELAAYDDAYRTFKDVR